MLVRMETDIDGPYQRAFARLTNEVQRRAKRVRCNAGLGRLDLTSLSVLLARASPPGPRPVLPAAP